MINDARSMPTKVLNRGDKRDIVTTWQTAEGATVYVCGENSADLPYETPNEAWWRGMLMPDTLQRLKALKNEPPDDEADIEQVPICDAIRVAIAVGKSHAAAAARLNRSGYRTQTGKEWTAQTLRRAKRRLGL